MNYFFLSNTALFHGLKEDEIENLLPCLGVNLQEFKKDDLIFRGGDVLTQMGLIMEGSVNIIVNFYWGGSNIFGHIKKGDIFGANYAAIPGQELFCDVVATQNCQILFLDMKKILTNCEKACPFHHRIIYNLFRISSIKNLNLSSRMMHIAPKTIRERLLSYLSEQAIKNSSHTFTVPFSRQGLADYLGVDRSALSNELSKMARDGLVSYDKNEFSLKEIK